MKLIFNNLSPEDMKELIAENRIQPTNFNIPREEQHKLMLEDKLIAEVELDGQVVRWNPNSGEKMMTIRVPAARVTSCAFGGPDLLDLYITTARSGLAEEQLAKQPHAGGIFRVRPGARGVPSFAFAG